MKKLVRAPFQDSFSKPDFEKKILKRIHVQSELDFARSLYREDPADSQRLVFSAEFDKKSLKRFKKLIQDIKKNRGFVSWGKLAVAAVLVGGYLLFNLAFKNLLMSNLLEESLEKVFGAQAEVTGLDFDPFGGRVTLASLAVANQDQPMRNLFELGETGFSIDLWQAVNGRILVNFLEFKEIRFDSARETSGALPGRPSGPAAPPSSPSQPAGAPVTSAAPAGWINLDQLDPAALVAAQLNQLESIRIAQSINQEITGVADLAKTESGSLSAKTKALAAASATRLVQNLASVKTKDQLKAALAKSADFKAEIGLVQKELDSYGKRLQDQEKIYEGRLKELRAAAQRDQGTLSKTLAQPQSAATKMLEGAARQTLGPQSLEWMAMARKIPAVLETLQGDEQPPTNAHRQGRTVIFPTAAHPQFEIKKVEGSILFGTSTLLGLKVDQISSDQEITGRPTTFQLDFDDTKITFHLNGVADLRKASPEKLVIEASMGGVAVGLGPEVAFLGLQSLSAVAGLEGTYRLDTDDNAKLVLNGTFRRVKTESVKDSLPGRISQTAIASLGGTVSLQGRLGLSSAGDFSFSLNSDLDRALAAGFQSAVNAEVQKLKSEVAAELEAQVTRALGAEKAGELKKYLAANASDIKSLGDLQKKVDKQTAELEKIGKALNGVKLPGF